LVQGRLRLRGSEDPVAGVKVDMPKFNLPTQAHTSESVEDALTLLGAVSGGGGGVVLGDGLVDTDSGVSIDLEAVPAAELTKDQVDRLKGLLEKAEGQAPFSAINIIHDEIVMEIPTPKPKKPVTATRTSDALLAKPELAWEVFQALKESKLLGPWVETETEDVEESAWVRRSVDGTPTTVQRWRRGWYYQDAKFCGSDIGTPTALAMMDDRLRDEGYFLA
jgi:hypothetical protein